MNLTNKILTEATEFKQYLPVVIEGSGWEKLPYSEWYAPEPDLPNTIENIAYFFSVVKDTIKIQNQEVFDVQQTRYNFKFKVSGKILVPEWLERQNKYPGRYKFEIINRDTISLVPHSSRLDSAEIEKQASGVVELSITIKGDNIAALIGDGFVKPKKFETVNGIRIPVELFNQVNQILYVFNVEDVKKKNIYKTEFLSAYNLVKKLGFETAKKVTNAVRLYTGRYYARTNNSLRTGKIPVSTSLIDAFVENADKLKSNKLYRGVNGEFFKTLKVGSVFLEKAFVSTTTDFGTAYRFSRKNGKGGVLIIQNVEGKAARIPLMVGMGENWSEDEYLLPRNCSFKVISIEKETATIILLD